MTKRKRHAFIWVGFIFGIIIAIAATIFFSTLDQNKAKKYISAGVSKATGRQLLINGDLKLDLGWISRVTASQIQFENAQWSKHPQMVDVGLVDVQIDLWQLLSEFRVVLPTVTISQPKVILEKNADGSANWEFRTASAVTEPVPEQRTQFPVIEKLIIKDGTFVFDDQETKNQLELRLTQAEAAGFLEEPVKLKAEGTYQKLPLTLSLAGGSYKNLRNSKEPYPLNINLGMGKVTAKIDGNLTDPLAMKGEDVTLDIQGDDMANLFPLIRLVFPSTPPYRLKGHLKHEGEIWSFSNFSGRVGGSDLSGNIRVDTEPKRPVMKADLVSNMLDFKDLAGFIGGTPGTASDETTSEEDQQKRAAVEKESDRIFPDQRYSLERLRAMDADVRLRAKRILAPNLPIDDLNAKLSLNDGVLRFDPAVFGVANGRIEVYSTFDGSKKLPKVNIDARLRQLDLKRFLGNSAFAQKTIGPIGGRINISGTGESFRQLMGTASGNTFLVMSGGEISELLVQLAGLDVARTLGVVVRGDKPIPIRCGLLDIQGENGQMGVQTLVFDTANSVVSGEGKIDLRDEKVNLVVIPEPKKFSPLSLRSFIRVTGGFKNVSVFPDPIKTGTESLFKKIFNVLTMLVLSPLQPRDLGLGKDVDCDALIASVQKQDPRGIVLKDLYKTG
jgi:AsmA family protein